MGKLPHPMGPHRTAAMQVGIDQRPQRRGAFQPRVQLQPEFAERREEILSMIWDMEEEIMGRAPGQAASA